MRGLEIERMSPGSRRRLFPRTGHCAFAFFMLCACTASWASLRERALPELHHTGWSAQSGAPSGITAIAQTADGMLWMGTDDGLFRFDGVRFSRTDEGTGIPYPNTNVRTLYAPPTGGLWIGWSVATHAPVFLDHGRQTEFPIATAGRIGTIHGFARDADGTVWVGYSGGLAKLDPDRREFVPVDGIPGGETNLIFADRSGTLWVGNQHEIYYRARGASQFEKGFDGFEYAIAIAQGPDDRLWIADDKGPVRVVRIADRGKSGARARIDLLSAGLRFDASGSLWIGTLGNGLRRLRAPEKFLEGEIAENDPLLERFVHDDGLTADYVWPLLVGREDQVWIGTSAGLDRFQERALVPANFPPGSHDFALIAGAGGAMWAGTTNRPLMRLVGRDLSVFGDVLPEITCAYRDHLGRVWFAGGNGVYRLDGEKVDKVAPYPVQAGGFQAQSMVFDAAGHLWVSYAGGKGLYEWTDTAWRHAIEVPEEKTAFVQMLDRTGRVWRGYASNTIIVSRADDKTTITMGALRSVFRKLEASSRAHAASIAIRRGLVEV